MLILSQPLCAQDAAPQKNERAQRAYDLFTNLAPQYAITDAEGVRVALRRQPVMNWVNPERYDKLGSVFVWEHAGMPLAIGTLFSYSVRESPRRKLALHSLADGPLTAKTPEGTSVWSPTVAGVTRRQFPFVVGDASSAAQRMIRMRQLARQFKVTLTDASGRPSALHLLPQPVLRYSSPEYGVRDGAIFGWMVGTDPDAFLLIECTDDGTWRYAFARFHFWKVTADLKGDQVWEAPEELDQKANAIGNPVFQDRVYSTMRIPITP